VDTIRKIVPQIIQFGKVTGPGLGVTFVNDEYARRAEVRGAVILEVPRDSAAYDASLRGLSRDNRGRLFIRDIITGIDEMKIASYDDLYNALDGYKIGTTVTLTVDQDGKSRKVRIVLVKSD
jgi:S1-C subfamily serine protease